MKLTYSTKLIKKACKSAGLMESKKTKKKQTKKRKKNG